MILHLDMDAFFAQVEQLDNPALRGRPVVIGGGKRGVVATASYEARNFGIRSAMSMCEARSRCPEAIFIRGRYERYSEISRLVMRELSTFCPVVQKASIDEAYADVGDLPSLAACHALAQAVQRGIFAATQGLTCSIGLAPVKFVAKICSDMRKPNGIFIVGPENQDAFLRALAVRKIPGVGEHMARKLQDMGIATISQLRALTRSFLEQRFGKWGAALYDRARGIDLRGVRPPPPQKSEGRERTLEKDTGDRTILRAFLAEHAEHISASLRSRRLAGRTITLKIKLSDFTLLTRSRSLPFRTNEMAAIFSVASSLLENLFLPQPVRLIGLAVSNFEERPEQLLLPGINPLRA